MITFILLVVTALVLGLAILGTVGILSIGCLAILIDPLVCVLLIMLIVKFVRFLTRKREV
jgi:hypothetical protein